MDKETEELLDKYQEEIFGLTGEVGLKIQIAIIENDAIFTSFKNSKEKLFIYISQDKLNSAKLEQNLSKNIAPGIVKKILDDSFFYHEDIEQVLVKMCVQFQASFCENAKNRIKNVYCLKHQESKTKLKSEFCDKVKNLPSSKKIDELYLINNCFKHNDGIASEILQNHKDSKWQKGEKINLSEEDIDEYTKCIESFLSELQGLI